jgi:hypothetical protein
VSDDEDIDYECSWTRHGVAALVVSRGAMRGPEAFDRYLVVINEVIDDPEVLAIISDLRLATRLPTVRDCMRFAKLASANPQGDRITRSAVVTADSHPLMALLLRIIAGASRFFPERRVFPNDVEGAIAWANGAPTHTPVPPP